MFHLGRDLVGLVPQFTQTTDLDHLFVAELSVRVPAGHSRVSGEALAVEDVADRVRVHIVLARKRCLGGPGLLCEDSDQVSVTLCQLQAQRLLPRSAPSASGTAQRRGLRA